MFRRDPLVYLPSPFHPVFIYHSGVDRGRRNVRVGGGFVWSVLVLFSLWSVGCSQRDVLREGELVIGIEGNPTDLDPRTATDAYSARINSLMYNGLVRLDPSAMIEPDLVQEIQIPEPTTYLFRLRKGVKFHNGKPLTSRDVRSTFLSILEPGLGSPRASTLKVIKEITIEDEYTVRFSLREPYAAFLNSLTTGIVPEGTENNPGMPPPGTGPFLLEEFQRGDRVVLRANGDYFEGPPRVQRVVFRVIPSDSTRVMELEQGGVHLLYNAVPPDILPVVNSRDDVAIIRNPGTSYSYLGFNLRDPVLADRRVREAIARAINRDSIIQDLLRGYARAARGLLDPGNWAYAGDVPQLGYDPERSRRLLDEAGFPDPDGEGPENRFTLQYKTSQDKLRIRIAEVIRRDLEAVGIGVDLRVFEWGTFFSDIHKGNFQLYSLTWVGITDPDIYYYIFHSKSLPPAGANRGGYSNASLDRLLETGRREIKTERRKQAYHKVQEILAREIPYVSLWHSDDVVVLRKEIKGFTIFPGGDLHSLKKVTIEW